VELPAGEHLAIGYLAQHQLESLDFDASPFCTAALEPAGSDSSIRNFLGGFCLSLAMRPCTDTVLLRRRKKARVALAVHRLPAGPPICCLLDEPTKPS